MRIFKRERRKRVLVDKPFQLRLALRNVMYMFAVGLSLSIPFFYFIRATNFLLYDHGKELNQIVLEQQRMTLITVGLYFLLLVCISALFTILQSPKIAGPTIGLMNAMKKLAEGDYSTRVHFRAGDELQALADTFNEMAEKIEARSSSRAENKVQSKSSGSKKSSLSSL